MAKLHCSHASIPPFVTGRPNRFVKAVATIFLLNFFLLFFTLSASAQLYLEDHVSGGFGVFDLTKKTFTNIGTTSVVFYDIAFDPHGTLYGVAGATGDLYTINITNASVSLVGGGGAAGLNAMAFRDDGTLFVAGGDALFTMDPTTGATTLIGTITGYSSAGSLVFDDDDNLYLSTSSNDLVRLDPKTAVPTLVGALGFQNVYGLAYDRTNNIMYGVTNAGGGNKIITIDTTTGAGTLLGTYPSSFSAGGCSLLQGPVTNPVPTLTALSPDRVSVGVPAFTLTLSGTRFVKSSVVSFGNTPLATTYVSGKQLSAVVPASLLTSAQRVHVTVSNPRPGGGTSNVLPFTIGGSNPVPVLTSVSPQTAVTESPAIPLTVTGKNFVTNSTVFWNKVALVTTYGSATGLSAVIPASLLTNAGTFSLSVKNPAPGGGTSNAVRFTLQNPVPKLTGLKPEKGPIGVSAMIALTGTNFAPGAKVYFGTNPVTTAYGSPTQLTAVIPATLLANLGLVKVTVANPVPGGGVSNALNFLVVKAVASVKVVMTPVPTVTRSGSNLLVTVQVTSTGNITADNLSLTGATLNGITFRSVTPSTPQTATAGATIPFTLTFPGTAAGKGATVPLTTTFTSTNAGTAYGTFQVTIP